MNGGIGFFQDFAVSNIQPPLPVRAQVQTSVGGHDVARLLIADGRHFLYEEGMPVRFSVGQTDLFNFYGYVRSIDPVEDRAGDRLVLWCTGITSRMAGGKGRFWKNATVKQVLRDVCQPYSIASSSTNPRSFASLAQEAGQSDWEFLAALAHRTGGWLIGGNSIRIVPVGELFDYNERTVVLGRNDGDSPRALKVTVHAGARSRAGTSQRLVGAVSTWAAGSDGRAYTKDVSVSADSPAETAAELGYLYNNNRLSTTCVVEVPYHANFRAGDTIGLNGFGPTAHGWWVVKETEIDAYPQKLVTKLTCAREGVHYIGSMPPPQLGAFAKTPAVRLVGDLWRSTYTP